MHTKIYLKKPLLCGLLACCTLCLAAQAYHPFSEKGTWLYQRYGDNGHPEPWYDIFETTGDTVLGGHVYNILYRNGAILGGLRDSLKVVSIRYFNETEEHILYDFNKKTNDTIINPYPWEPQMWICDTFQVMYESEIPTKDGSRRSLGLISPCWGTEWIESIGNEWWLTSPDYLGSVSGGSYLACFYDAGKLVYAVDGSSCTSTLEEIGSAKAGLAVFPNPTAGLLRLKIPLDDTAELEVFNGAGKRVAIFPMSSETLDLSPLPDGIYWLQVRSAKNVQVLRVLKNSGAK